MRRVLAIDGGGIKGVFPAAFLSVIEEAVKGKAGDYFDLIVGTSTGGIIALGLGLGFSASEILKFYEDSGPTIFGGNQFARLLRHLWLSKYSPDDLKAALEKQFGSKRLGDSRTRLVIPSFNPDTGKVHIFKTAHHSRLELDYKIPIVDVAMATAAAPSYFPTHRLAAGTPLVDGGMWANNPVGIAVVEAISILGWKPGEIQVLSLGCTSPPLNVGWGKFVPRGLIYWGIKSIEVFMVAQSHSSVGIAQHLAGKENVIRVDPSAPRGKYHLDNVRAIPSLRGLGYTEAREWLPKLRPIFFETKAEIFKPVYTP